MGRVWTTLKILLTYECFNLETGKRWRPDIRSAWWLAGMCRENKRRPQ